MRKRAYIFLVIAIALAGFILFTSTNTGATHSQLGGRTIQWVNEVFFGGSLSEMEKSSIVGVAVKLFGHFGLFCLDGLFFFLFLRETPLKLRGKTLMLICIGIILSCLGEFIQLFSDGRNGNVFDIVIDYSGYMLIPLFLLGLRKK